MESMGGLALHMKTYLLLCWWILTQSTQKSDLMLLLAVGIVQGLGNPDGLLATPLPGWLEARGGWDVSSTIVATHHEYFLEGNSLPQCREDEQGLANHSYRWQCKQHHVFCVCYLMWYPEKWYWFKGRAFPILFPVSIPSCFLKSWFLPPWRAI